MFNQLGFFVLFLSALPLSSSLNSAFADTLVGNWRGEGCDSYNDGTLTAKYNRKFTKTGDIEDYLEGYSDRHCQKESGEVVPLAKGTYFIEDSSQKDGLSIYTVKVKYSHLDYLLSWRITLNKNTMTLCRSDHSDCARYTRILD